MESPNRLKNRVEAPDSAEKADSSKLGKGAPPRKEGYRGFFGGGGGGGWH